ncbi:Hypothetical protein POVR2_LOCUS334 [uncultured virus]|nr:Hypothetical protein POVR2_LOCUS334 [uncultured virus]
MSHADGTSKFDPYKISGIFIATSMVDGELSQSELDELMNRPGVYSDLLRWLASKNQSARQVVSWLESYKPDVDLLDAIDSILDKTLPHTEVAAAIRALIWTLIHGTLTLSEHIAFLRQEGMSDSSIELSVMLIGAYYGELDTRLR